MNYILHQRNYTIPTTLLKKKEGGWLKRKENDIYVHERKVQTMEQVILSKLDSKQRFTVLVKNTRFFN